MDHAVVPKLDCRGKWVSCCHVFCLMFSHFYILKDRLPSFQPHEISQKLDLTESDLKILCLQQCFVVMSKFNVLARM